MNHSLLLLFLTLCLLLVICYFKKNNIEDFKSFCVKHPITFTFFPYYTTNTHNLSKRGCHNSHYWDCVVKHKDYNNNLTIDKNSSLHKDCIQYSNTKCTFPPRISHSRKEPYYQYLNYI